MAKKSKAPQVQFDALLVLFRFMLGEIGLKELKTLSKTLNSTDYEGLNEEGHTIFSDHIALIPNLKITKDKLLEYDSRICSYTKQIGEKRGGIKWKYFQYVSLLFTEIYLDRYFADKEAFCAELNEWVQTQRDQSLGAMWLSDYTPQQLNKLAYMCATGSGKTLTMHINILQFLHYLRRAQRSGGKMKINKILLVTPNEGMSRQHLEELELSNIKAHIFEKETFQSVSGYVQIIDINKIKDESKDKTVAVDTFERNNLLLVDEAHRGLKSGDVWIRYRRQLAEDGFTFEYSATLKQSLNANAKEVGDRELMDEYGKSIIMDYSYKYFYNDGYGKDYRIYNLKAGIGDESRMTYLTGCLLSFYQQVRYFEEYGKALQPFNIEKPLLVFVGRTVTSSKSGSKFPDVQDVLQFIDNFLRNKAKTIKRIDDVINERTGLTIADGRDVFQSGLNALWDIYGGTKPTPEVIYQDVLRYVFNSDSTSDEPRLRVEAIKQVQGEIAMRIGDGEYFGVINVGNTDKLIELCGKNGIVARNEEFLKESLFRNINKKNSNIKILIGSQKFVEGWNSWRVSTMGLINFAKEEGPQAIQLFGRGVRLKGYGGNLKRSSVLEGVKPPKNIRYIETLTIFGVRAQYMEEFNKLLKNEGVPHNNEIINIKLPVVSRFSELQGKALHIIKVKNGINFKKQSKRLILDVPQDDFMAYLNRSKTRIDCRSKIQNIVSDGSFGMQIQAVIEENIIGAEALQLLNYYRIFDELQAYKNEKSYFNISIERERIKAILAIKGWYSLIIPEKHLKINSYSQIELVTDFAIMVMKSYMDKFFKFEKQRWETPYLEYQDLAANDNNFVEEYSITYTRQNAMDNTGEELEKFISEANDLLSQHKCIPEYRKKGVHDALVLFDFRSHLYAPLISLANESLKIQISPVSLNADEMRFVDMLKAYTEANAEKLADKSLYLLRNKSKVGMGFFEAGNFYPDYILWIDTAEKQYISFIDPKGLMRIIPDNPKIQFYKAIKELEYRLQKKSICEKPIVLNSFILSATKSADLREWWATTRYKDKYTRESINVYTLDDINSVNRMMDKILLCK